MISPEPTATKQQIAITYSNQESPVNSHQPTANEKPQRTANKHNQYGQHHHIIKSNRNHQPNNNHNSAKGITNRKPWWIVNWWPSANHENDRNNHLQWTTMNHKTAINKKKNRRQEWTSRTCGQQGSRPTSYNRGDNNKKQNQQAMTGHKQHSPQLTTRTTAETATTKIKKYWVGTKTQPANYGKDMWWQDCSEFSEVSCSTTI